VEDKAEWSPSGPPLRKPLRHWIHASELMAPVAGERATIIRRILFSRHVRSAVKIFPVSAMIERPLLSLSFLLLRALARLQGLRLTLVKRAPRSFPHLNARARARHAVYLTAASLDTRYVRARKRA